MALLSIETEVRISAAESYQEKMITVSVIGCGHMGSALLEGLTAAGGYRTIGYDVDPAVLDDVESYCDHTTTDIDAITDADIVALTVKPDIVPTVLAEIDLHAEQTLMTAAAGVERSFVSNQTDATVVRLMPNLAASLREMAAAVAWDEPDPHVETMLSDLGSYVVIDETQMNVATALNGSGPAFVYYLIQAMQMRAVEEGLDKSDAQTLAIQTFIGAAEMVRAADESIDSLIDAVCSPNGTTIEGMNVLFDSNVDTEIGDALTAATERSAELAAEVDHE
ncbi:MAG: pyrroline-5-carboxylate reductase [Haloquadratum walsbyi J07HQW1]|uniref:Pyrroline-5-carboxylate reductase n=1 Tax=Haloquadratum walsbyi J07HQW1 TaxID=1238424 RepID=U1N3R0_9EURY|nr:MAG: pyrroline-5-carboxylate reductase [Haloquadratum walsbyi J07HQW1]